MSKEVALVVKIADQLLVSSYVIAKKTGLKHSNVKISSNRLNINPLIFTVDGNNSPKRRGRPLKEWFFSEEDAIKIVYFLSKDSPEILNFKNQLIEEFFKQKELLKRIKDSIFNSRASYEDYDRVTVREGGKVVRRSFTDMLKVLGERCERENHPFLSCKSVYGIVTRNINYSLILPDDIKAIKSGFRDYTDILGLSSIMSVEQVLKRIIEEGEVLNRSGAETYALMRSKAKMYGYDLGPIRIDRSLKLNSKKNEMQT